VLLLLRGAAARPASVRNLAGIGRNTRRICLREIGGRLCTALEALQLSSPGREAIELAAASPRLHFARDRLCGRARLDEVHPSVHLVRDVRQEAEEYGLFWRLCLPLLQSDRLRRFEGESRSVPGRRPRL